MFRAETVEAAPAKCDNLAATDENSRKCLLAAQRRHRAVKRQELIKVRKFRG